MYLVREGKYQNRAHELEAVQHHNMPAWAEGKPMSFWAAADTYERANGRVYNELEISLPRELSAEKRRELGEEFAKKELGEGCAYTLAFHNSKALDGEENPHIHLMFSERRLDGVERGPEQFFRRYNAEKPELGGARKERLYWRPADVENLRERWARHVNKALEREGIEERIDHRSYKRQGIEREPEPKLGPAVTARAKRGRYDDRFEEVMEVREYRKLEEQRLALEKEIGAERAKIYNLEEERVKRGYRIEADPSESEEEREERKKKYWDDETKKRAANPEYKRTVDFICDRVKTAEGVEFRFKRSGEVAFVDYGDRIETQLKSDAVVKSMAQVAKEKGWERVLVEGNEEGRRKLWLELKLQGMDVTGYEARQADHEELARRIKERDWQRAETLVREKAARVKEYPAKQAELRREAERGQFAEPADRLVARFRDDILPKLDTEHREISDEMKALGWKPNPEDGFRQEWCWPDPLTKEGAWGQAWDDVAGKGFVEDRERVARLDKPLLEKEKALEELRREHSAKSWWQRQLDTFEFARKERALLEEIEALREPRNKAAMRHNDRREELSTPENQAKIQKRAAELLREDQEKQKARKLLDKRHERVTTEIKQARLLQRSCRELGKERITVEWTQGKRSLRAVNPDDLEEKVNRARKMAKNLSRGMERGR